MRVTILGCGGSSGTPSIDRGWGRCDPQNPRNRRTRSSILVEDGETRILVDTSPDLREQLIRADVRRLDSVLFTHSHADHVHGIDDLRPINRAMNAPLPVYADEETLATIDKRFGYVFEALSEDATMYYKPVLVPHTVTHGDEFTVGRIPIRVFTQDHGYCDSLGFRLGPVAYSSDAVELPDDAFEMLQGVKLWIIGTLTDTPHPTHAHVDKAVDWMKRVGAEHGVLTHMSGLLDYDTLAAHLPDWVEPAYDGLVIDTES